MIKHCLPELEKIPMHISVPEESAVAMWTTPNMISPQLTHTTPGFKLFLSMKERYYKFDIFKLNIKHLTYFIGHRETEMKIY